MKSRWDASAVDAPDGSRAIEVAAMFEDAVVAVRHLTDPGRGTASTATRLYLGGGIAALGLALGAFVAAYLNVGALIGGTLDLATLLAASGGLFALLRGLQRRAAEREPTGFTIGPERGTSFQAPGDALPCAAFPLVCATTVGGGDYQLTFTAAMQGEVVLDGHTITLAELVARNLCRPSAEIAGAFIYAIPAGARIRVALGANTFHVSSVPAPRRYSQPMQIDWGQQSYTAACALAAGLALAMIYSIPPDPHALSVDDFMASRRFVTFLNKAVQEEQTKVPAWLNKYTDGKTAEDAGGRAQGATGKLGKQGAPAERKKYALKGPADNRDLRLAKDTAFTQAINSGPLSILRGSMGTTQVAAIWGSDSAIGHDASNILGGLVGTEIGESDGVPGGLGVFGKDHGGGGTRQTIGLTDLDTIGKDGLHKTLQRGDRLASLPVDKKKFVDIGVPAPPMKVRGGIDKAIVRRVVHMHLNEVKFCYEKELMHKPDLFGRVVTDFTISGNGVVLSSSVQSSTMNDAAVEGCIANAVRRWEFPKPDGGGLVVVSYPFVLKHTGVN